MEKNIITRKTKIAETMNTKNAGKYLDIQGYQTNFSPNINLDKIANAVNKFKDHQAP